MTREPAPDDWLTTRQVARMLGTTRARVWWLVLTGQLGRYRVAPDAPTIPDAQIDAWIDHHRPQPPRERL